MHELLAKKLYILEKRISFNLLDLRDVAQEVIRQQQAAEIETMSKVLTQLRKKLTISYQFT